MSDLGRLRRSKPLLFFFISFVLVVSPASASLIDPIPVFENIIESPHHKIAFLKDRTQFLCPLFQKFCNPVDEVAAQTLILEALGEGYEGMLAVGEVIRNRTKLFLKDANTICRMPKQFSCWNDEVRARRSLEKYHEYYFVALTIWMNSKNSALTHGATDYHADSIHPFWADAYRIAAHIGRHVFYVRN